MPFPKDYVENQEILVINWWQNASTFRYFCLLLSTDAVRGEAKWKWNKDQLKWDPSVGAGCVSKAEFRIFFFSFQDCLVQFAIWFTIIF